MNLMRNDAPQAKLGILAVIMAGLLAASVALAWIVSIPRENNSSGAAEIIAKLADDTLEGYWTGSQRETWFIGRRRDAKPVAWRMRSRRRESKNVFSGSLLAGTGRVTHYQSSWRLNTDLSEGAYLGRVFDKGGRVLAETRIMLTDKEITVISSIPGRKLAVTAARPMNYIPEDVLPLVLKLAASRGGETTFKMIVDKNAIVGGIVNFVNVSLIPLGDNVVRVKVFGRGSTFTTIYQIDSHHDISRSEDTDNGVIYRLCKKELVLKTFRIPSGGPVIPVIRGAP